MIKLFENKKFILLLALTNFLIGFFSISYYLPQLSRTDFWLWLFVIDCPLYSILFGLLLLLRFKEKNFLERKYFSLLGLIVIVGGIKYGFWTIFVLFLSNNIFSAWLITVSHIFLFLQVIVFYKFFKFKIKYFFIAVFWFLLNDFFDYVLLTHPFFDTIFFTEVAIFSIISSFVITLFVTIFFSKKKINFFRVRKKI